MGPMVWSRLDGKIITDEYVTAKYFGILNADNYKNMLEELRIARKWNLTIEEFNEWMDSVNDDMAKMYFHNIFCNCGMGMHFDGILGSMGAIGVAMVERRNVRGSIWPFANADWVHPEDRFRDDI